MTISLTINGTSYDYPETGDLSWGPDATDWALAVTNGMLQKAGGVFQLLAEVDFGTAFGVKSLYFKSRTANNASAGQYRLARTDVISWRNEANSGNLDLTVDSSNALYFNGTPLVSLFTGVTDTNSINLTLTGTVLSADLNVSAASADPGNYNVTLDIETDGLHAQLPIATSSLTGVLSSTDWTTFNSKQAGGNYITALTGDVTASGPGSVAATITAGIIVNSMINASAAIDYSKLSLTNSIVNADINSGAAIAYTKLALTGTIVNADISAAAAVTRSKLASGSNNHVIINDGSGVMSSEATLAKSRGGSGQDNSSLNFPASGTLSTLAGTEAFTNKDYNGGTASNTSRLTVPSNTKSNLDALTRKEATLVYATDDDLLYVDDGTNLVAVGSGTSTIINYITNSSATYNTTGWATYADAAGVAPVDGTGGSPVITWTRSTSSPLAGVASFLLTKDAANRQGEGVAYAFTSNADDQGQVDYFSCTFQTSANYVAGDVRFYLIDVTNSVVIEPVNVQLPANGNYGRQVSYFQLPINSTSYRLCVHIASTSALAYTIKFDSFFFGPQNLYTGSMTTDWVSSTPTVGFTGGTLSTSSMYSRRVGDTGEVKVALKWSTIFTGGAATINLPSGWVLDTSKFPGTIASPEYILGRATLYDISNVPYFASVIYNSTTSVILRPEITVGGNTYGAITTTAISTTYPFTWANNDEIFVEFSAPVVGWSSGVQLASQATNQVIGFRATLTGNQAIASTSVTKITLNTVTATGCYDISGSFDTTNNRFVVPESGLYQFTGRIQASSYTSAEVINARITIDGSTTLAQNGGSIPSTDTYCTVSASARLNKGQTVELGVDSVSDNSYSVVAGADFGTYFEGFKIQGNQTIGMDEFVGASYETNAGQSVPDATLTTLTYEDKIDDSHNAYNTTTGEYTIPVAGRYLINAKMIFTNATAWAVAETAQIRIYVNGTEKSTSSYELPGTPGTNIQVNPTVVFYQANFNRGDIITIRVNQTSGATQSVRNFAPFNTFAIARIK